MCLLLLGLCRKRFPDFSIVAWPSYDLTRKQYSCDWTLVHEEVLKLLGFETGIHEALGPIHPEDPLQVEWGSPIHGLSIHVWECGPEDPTHPIQFHSPSFKDTEKQDSLWERGLR